MLNHQHFPFGKLFPPHILHGQCPPCLCHSPIRFMSLLPFLSLGPFPNPIFTLTLKYYSLAFSSPTFCSKNCLAIAQGFGSLAQKAMLNKIQYPQLLCLRYQFAFCQGDVEFQWHWFPQGLLNIGIFPRMTTILTHHLINYIL